MGRLWGGREEWAFGARLLCLVVLSMVWLDGLGRVVTSFYHVLPTGHELSFLRGVAHPAKMHPAFGRLQCCSVLLVKGFFTAMG